MERMASYSDTFGGGGWQGFGEYLATKSNRIHEQLVERHGQTEEIFKGCHFWLDGRCKVPETKLKELMILHGGVYESYDLSKVTHVVADNLALGNKKWQQIRYASIMR